jgi:hypothetical protein
LLATVSELHSLLSSRPGVSIGRSKFAALRPPYCITAATSGSHVCVCIYHENANLRIKGSLIKESYKELMTEIVCSIDKEISMVQRCANCPDNSNLREYFISSIEEEYVRFSTWEITNGSFMITNEIHVVKFIELLVTSLTVKF